LSFFLFLLSAPPEPLGLIASFSNCNFPHLAATGGFRFFFRFRTMFPKSVFFRWSLGRSSHGGFRLPAPLFSGSFPSFNVCPLPKTRPLVFFFFWVVFGPPPHPPRGFHPLPPLVVLFAFFERRPRAFTFPPSPVCCIFTEVTTRAVSAFALATDRSGVGPDGPCLILFLEDFPRACSGNSRSSLCVYPAILNRTHREKWDFVVCDPFFPPPTVVVLSRALVPAGGPLAGLRPHSIAPWVASSQWVLLCLPVVSLPFPFFVLHLFAFHVTSSTLPVLSNNVSLGLTLLPLFFEIPVCPLWLEGAVFVRPLAGM